MTTTLSSSTPVGRILVTSPPSEAPPRTGDSGAKRSAAKVPSDLERVLRSLASELRLEILEAMTTGARSPVQVSRRLDMPLGTIAYHVRFLREAGLVRVTEKRPARGAIENLYEVTELGQRVQSAVGALVRAVHGEPGEPAQP